MMLEGRPRGVLIAMSARDSQSIAQRYPGVDVHAVADPLEGIAACAAGNVCVVLLHVDPGTRRVESAVRGLRDVLGDGVPVVLSCEPAVEPLARRLLDAGASDYVIEPPDGPELDRALQLSPAGAFRDMRPEAPPANLDELARLSEVLAHLSDGVRPVLERIATLLQTASHAAGVSLSYQSVTVKAGASFDRPVLCEPIVADGETIGQIAVGPRSRRAYGAADAEKLQHYARLIGHLLRAAEHRQHWERLARTDEVSGLGNRRHLRQSLERLLQRAERERFRVTLLCFDIDNFKRYNDAYGHAAGDEILRELGQLFQRHCRRQDVVTRYGGDEFAVVFWDAEAPRVAGSKHPGEAISVLSRFRAALESHEFPSLGPEACGTLTISGGLASFPWDARSVDELLERADQALRAAKQHGKNRIYVIGRELPTPLEDVDMPLEDTI
jgi:diguanylate cyclase (GGDEF)-like protein